MRPNLILAIAAVMSVATCKNPARLHTSAHAQIARPRIVKHVFHNGTSFSSTQSFIVCQSVGLKFAGWLLVLLLRLVVWESVFPRSLQTVVSCSPEKFAQELIHNCKNCATWNKTIKKCQVHEVRNVKQCAKYIQCSVAVALTITLFGHSRTNRHHTLEF